MPPPGDVVRRARPLRYDRCPVASMEELQSEICALRQRVAELEAAEAQARAILEAAGQAILIVDQGGTILSVNRQAETTFGYSRDRLIGTSLEMLLPARLRERHGAHRATYFRDPHIRPMGRGLDLVALRADGTEFAVEISLSYVQ